MTFIIWSFRRAIVEAPRLSRARSTLRLRPQHGDLAARRHAAFAQSVDEAVRDVRICRRGTRFGYSASMPMARSGCKWHMAITSLLAHRRCVR